MKSINFCPRGQLREILDATPPNDVALEARIVGMLLVDPRTISTVSAILRPKHLYNSRAAEMYRAILELWNGGSGAVDTSLRTPDLGGK